MTPLRFDDYGDESPQSSPRSTSPKGPLQPQQRKVVLFVLERNEMHPIRSLSEIDAKEAREIWGEKTDLDTVRRKVYPILRKMMKGIAVEETSEQTVRGLECRTKQGALRRQRNKVEALSAVLDEQEQQRDNDELDEDRIAMVYRVASAISQAEARAMALRDQATVQEELDVIRAKYGNSNSNETTIPPPSRPGLRQHLCKQSATRRLPLTDHRRELQATCVMGPAA